MLNPHWLRTFKTLVDTGHFTLAAKKLFMTQPGVSQHVKKLEAACGHRLVIRDNKRFALTEQGQLVYQFAKDSEASETRLLEQLNIDNPYTGVCKLACSGALALRLYPQLLEIQQRYPTLGIALEVAPNERILEGIEAGDLDYGLVTVKPDKNLFDYEKTGDDELCLILPNGVDCSSPVFHTLQALGLINHPDALHYLSLYFSRCGMTELTAANPREIPLRGYINQLVQILLPVSQGLGFTVLPRHAVEHYPHQHALKIMKPSRQVKEPVFGVRARHRQLPDRYQLIIATIKTHLQIPC